jgi:uncharacterized membrane protein
VTWGTSFRVRGYIRGSLWIVPLVGGVLGSILGGLNVVDYGATAPDAWRYSPSTATTLLATIAGAMAALAGFVVTVTVLVVQIATGTLSPRYMRLWYRDRMLKAVLAVLFGTLTYSFALLPRVSATFVPDLGVTIAGALVIVALLLFLIFLDRFVHRLRPVAVATLAVEAGRRAFRELDRPATVVPSRDPDEEPALTVRAPRAGAVQAVHTRGLVRWASARDCVVVLLHPIGDFVFEEAPLIEVYGDPGDAGRPLGAMVALGIERTTEQDPAFALRVLVDVAIRALSPAVNDPTTAVQILDHMGELLREIGGTELPGRLEWRDAEGRARLVLPERRWDEYLSLGVTEIREYGGTSVQVMRRLRAVLEDLRESVRPEHRVAVDAELERLDRTVEASFHESVDFDLASTPDGQGLGGVPRAEREAALG